MSKIRLLIVEDSAFLRSTYEKILSDISSIEIVGAAKNGKEAVEMAKSLSPDVITMDIEMPVMNGLEALKIIMQDNPIPTLMVSSLTKEGAEATIEALNLGAIDFIPKETAFSKVSNMKDDMVEKITTIGGNSSIKNRILRRTVLNKESSNKSTSFSVDKLTTRKTTNDDQNHSNILEKELPKRSKLKAISIGISTGGPISLQKLIPNLSPNINIPIFIVQHMPPNFTKSLAERLDKISNLKVKEAENGETINGRTVYFAPGGYQMLINHGKILITDKKPANELYSPSFNIALGSQIHYYGNAILAIVMTGMGNDGTIAMKKLSEIGGYNIAQDPNTCVVAGMPNSALKAEVINRIEPLENIASSINSIFD
jgi:two-component system chemotaxis response regulator CheB